MKSFLIDLKRCFREFRIFCIHFLTGLAKPLSIEDCVILAPHPDDETFGCGSLIAATVRAGKRVEIVILSDGSASHAGCCDIARDLLVKARKKSAVAALEALGVSRTNVHFLRLTDGKLADEIPTHKAEILELLNSFGIRTLFAPHPLEGWTDHEAVSHLGDELQKSGWQRYYYCVWFYFSMPFRRFSQVVWSRAFFLKNPTVHSRKKQAAAVYLHDCSPCGNPYAGVLPEELKKAVLYKREIFFS